MGPCSPHCNVGRNSDPEWTLGECRRSAADDPHGLSAEEINDDGNNVSDRRDVAQAPWTARLHGQLKDGIGSAPISS